MAKKSKKGKIPIAVESLELGLHNLNFNDPWEGHNDKVERDQKKRNKEIKDSYRR